ncbi:RNA polymerase sigma factor [Stieleria varia]|uniref:ECF RNA polymerase sigma factor SigE n=1 Tax=Stieleria varia TaxID=2528005 RepID=A0A5C5ZWT0_9BACT|nr:sigma-70 family RNA polymerase sigma factor [Stieleria varia]TWT91586.1 ECF RNA polymerase sigma factor SigE [Stieleria varia]
MPLTSPSTSLSLIRRVQTNDPRSWERLVQIYGPLVYRWCRRRGIDRHDASDIMQDVFSAVSGSIDRFQSEQGQRSFRGWLYGITRFKMLDHFRQSMKRPDVIAGDVLDATLEANVDADPYLDDPAGDRIDAGIIIRQTLELIRQEFTDVTWKAFWRTAVDKQSAPDVAAELGLQPANVRQIKRRVMKRLRDELDGLEPGI